MKTVVRIGIAALALVITGCATLNKNECANANWEMIGYEDGRMGASSSRMQRHREACAKHGYSVNFTQYQQGYSQGVIGFCTASNGFSRGKSGYQYEGICPVAQEAAFLSGYGPGHQIYLYKKTVLQLDKQIRIKTQLIEDTKAQIEVAKANFDPKVDGAIDALLALTETLGALEAELLQLHIDRAAALAGASQVETDYLQ